MIAKALCSAVLVGLLPWSAGAQPPTSTDLAGESVEAPPLPPSGERRERSDRAITDAVVAEIGADPAVALDHIEVETDGGIVRLQGTVSNLLARDRATELAEAVKGVRAVVNYIEVRPSEPRSDRALHQDIAAALDAHPAVEASDIDVEAEDGIVTLTGTVGAWLEMQAALRVAKSVRGVRGVRNRMGFDFDEQLSEAEIESRVGSALRWDALVDDSQIEVQAEGHRVTLSGVVGSAAEKRRAMKSAGIPGVEEVDVAALEVDPAVANGGVRHDSPPGQRDAELRQAVLAVLRADPRVDAEGLQVEVAEGVVVLRGEVATVDAKLAAGSGARTTLGVVAVDNRLKVEPREEITQARLEQALEAAIDRSPYLEPYDIHVVVAEGIAFLTGIVSSSFEKAEAHRIAASVRGIRSVQNMLSVLDESGPPGFDPYVDEYALFDYDWYKYEPPTTARSDAEIRQDIENQLFWSPLVDGQRVGVEVHDGVAYLRGTVSSWAARQAAAENAFEGGAVWVENDLVIDTGRGEEGS